MLRPHPEQSKRGALQQQPRFYGSHLVHASPSHLALITIERKVQGNRFTGARSYLCAEGRGDVTVKFNSFLSTVMPTLVIPVRVTTAT
jgi:hypothetical protein